jgi:GAF domain-containing protein
MDADEFPWLTARLQRGDSVMVSSLEELPHEATVDRRSYLAYRVKPCLAVPLVVGGTVVGGLVFSPMGASRGSSEDLTQQLNLLAESLCCQRRGRQVERVAAAATGSGAHRPALDRG